MTGTVVGTIILVAGLGPILLTALPCGMAASGLPLAAVARRTFLPLTTREFWMPPCALCWVARVAVVAVMIGVVLQFWPETT